MISDHLACWKPTWRSPLFYRALTGSTGRATNIQSSLLRWSWDPATSETSKAGANGRKFQGQLGERGVGPRERSKLYQSISTISPTIKPRPGIWQELQLTVDHWGQWRKHPPHLLCEYFLRTKDNDLHRFLFCCLNQKKKKKTSSDSITMVVLLLGGSGNGRGVGCTVVVGVRTSCILHKAV